MWKNRKEKGIVILWYGKYVEEAKARVHVKVLEKKPNELKIEIEGEDHSFCNVLQKALLEDDTIEMVGYNIPHPLVSSPIVYVRTKGQRRPETALKNAAEKIKKRNREFRETFEKALKEWQKSKPS